MLSQWFFGFFLESKYGTKKFVILYLLAGIGGNLLSAAFATVGTSIGASSSLFGLIAFQCAYLYENWDKLGPAKNTAVLWLAIILISNIANATQNTGIDNLGHLGGFIFGGLIAVQIIDYYPDSKWHQKQKIAKVIAILFAVGLTIYMFSMRSSLVWSSDIFAVGCSYVGW